jgi:hypothetical protein
MDHEKVVQEACNLAIEKLGWQNKIKFRPMKRSSHVNIRRGFVIGRTNLKTGLITIDIWTPKFRRPKTVAGILRTLAHEIAHHQKRPFRQRFRGRVITRAHYPEFYQQVSKNILFFKKDKILNKFFI